MARYLAVGNLNSSDAVLDTAAMRIFLGNTEVEFLHTGSSRNILAKEAHTAKDAAQNALNGSFDLIIAGDNGFPYPSPRKFWAKNIARIVRQVVRYPNLLTGYRFPYSKVGSPLAGLDMHDRPVIDNRWFKILDSCVCFFKRELTQNPCNAFLYTTDRSEVAENLFGSERFPRWMKKLRPISLGIAPEAVSRYSALNYPKKTDVFFAGDLKWRPSRLAGFEQLEQLKKEGLAIDIAYEKVPHDEFFRRCAQASIVWSPEGGGWDCFRHYEAALAGSVPLMPMPTIRRYAPLEDGEHALYYYVEGNHLASRVRQALQNRTRLVEMGQASRRHVLRWHTHEALGRYVIEETKRSAIVNVAN
jgi:hypothetical protein